MLIIETPIRKRCSELDLEGGNIQSQYWRKINYTGK